MRAVTPDANLFPEFDDNLRQALQRETELFVESQIREDRSVVELLTANYTFLNERLARHYGIPNVHGSHFRRVDACRRPPRRPARPGQHSDGDVARDADLAGLARQVGARERARRAAAAAAARRAAAAGEGRRRRGRVSVRARLEQHRSNPVCASCHSRMDPLGFALENFDAIGKWRAPRRGGAPVDASAALPDGTSSTGPGELRALLESRREEFVADVTTKLLTYALGRGRRVLRSARDSRHRPRRGGERLPLVVDHAGHRRERAVSDEEGGAMIVTRKAIPRRTFLRGLGATVALPLLDAMVPAFAAQRWRPRARRRA